MADRALYIDVDIDSGTTSFDITIEGHSGERLPYYEGSYEVDPRKVSQTLETANKSMADDVTVNAIFYSEVANPSGGDTVYIGME